MTSANSISIFLCTYLIVVVHTIGEHLCRIKDSYKENCNQLSVTCLSCIYEESCVYGNKTYGNCTAAVPCTGNLNFKVEVDCYYCYQLPKEKYSCDPRAYCQSYSSPQNRIIVNCTVHPKEHCLGRRNFLKSFPCNWTTGTRWSTAFLLSVTLGGFGADRFYLGHWRQGLGKLFSFGGLGIWTLVDVVLIAIGYITPEDGSLYIF